MMASKGGNDLGMKRMMLFLQDCNGAARERAILKCFAPWLSQQMRRGPDIVLVGAQPLLTLLC